METSKLSTKGQIVLPKTLRDAHGWPPGIEFEIEDRPDGILLRPVRLFPPATADQVFASLHHQGPPKTIEEMEGAIEREAKRNFSASVRRSK